ncbi:MAG: hypothetical protein Tsb009_02200 [Planctomycetaceae bacterium]
MMTTKSFRGRTTREESSVRRFRGKFVLVVCLVLLNISPPVHAQESLSDVVVLRSKRGSGRITVPCIISDYTGRRITIRTRPEGRRQSFPAEDVISVKTPQSRRHVQGLAAFTKQQFQEAQTHFEKALTLENREWVRREIVALLIRCAYQQNDFSSACTRFMALIKSDSHTRHVNLLPLIWQNRDLKQELKSQARQWLNEKETVPRLIGASILLFDRNWSNSAEITLVQLTRDSSRPFRELARMQLWRKKLRSQRVNSYLLKDWHSQVDALQESMRGGPYFLLGQAHRKLRENERAAAAFLWLPTVYDTDPHLASEACLQAADCLWAVGQKSEARTLYREVVVRFSKTAAAQEAKNQLKKLQSPTARSSH